MGFGKAFSDGVIAGVAGAISAPSLVYYAFIFSLKFLGRTPTSAPRTELKSQKACLNSDEKLTFLIGSSLSVLLCFRTSFSSCSIQSISALFQIISISNYLRRTASAKSGVFFLLLIFVGLLSSKIARCFDPASTRFESWLLPSDLHNSQIVICACLVTCLSLVVGMAKFSSKAGIVSFFSNAKNIDPEELLLKMDHWNRAIISAVYILIVALIIIVESIRFCVSEYESYFPFLWVNFCTSTTILVIDIYVMKSDIYCGSLKLNSTVKKSYLRYISHEIRTPVNALSIGVRMLIDEMKRTKLVDKDKMELLGCMESACTVTVDMLNDILTMDKIGTKTMEIRKQSVEAQTFVSETLKMFVPSAREKRIVLSVTNSASSGTDSRRLEPFDCVDIDVFKMRQVLRNVVSNGIKFTPHGGHVEVCLGVARIKGSETLQIVVQDSGAGMDSESTEKAFKGAFQYKPEVLQGGGGSGFGLLISNEIIRAHDGLIEVFSEGHGKGSTVTIQLPMSAVPSSDARSESPTSLQHGNFLQPLDSPGSQSPPDIPEQQPLLLKFLVADDSSSCRKMTVRAIRSFAKGLGFDVEVCEAKDGVEAVLSVAVANTSGSPFDIVFMDGNMPNLNGPTATHQIRSGGCSRPIIGVTGNAHESEVAEFMKSGATMVWTKPIEMSSLKASIKEAADVKASLVQEQTTQENPEIAELKAKLAMKRAALQLASVDMRELRASYEIEKESTVKLAEGNLDLRRVLSSVRLQAAAESADHQRIVASKDMDIQRLVNESEDAAETALQLRERNAAVLLLARSVSETERAQALITAEANSRESARVLVEASTEMNAVLEGAALRASETRFLCESSIQRVLQASEDATRAALLLSENVLKKALETAAADAATAAVANEEACKVAFALSVQSTAAAWDLSELNILIALKLSDDAVAAALSLSEKNREEASIAASAESREAVSAALKTIEGALVLSEQSTVDAWSLCKAKSELAFQMFEEKMASLSFGDADSEATFNATLKDVKIAWESILLERETVLKLSARNAAQSWSLSKFNSEAALQASDDAASAALSWSEHAKTAALESAFVDAQLARAEFDRILADAATLSESNADRAFRVYEKSQKAASAFFDTEKAAFNRVIENLECELAFSKRNSTDAELEFAATAWSLFQLNAQTERRLALELASANALEVSAANAVERVAALELSAINTAKAWSLSEMNAQTALKVSEDATRAALSLSEVEKGAALLLAASDAQVVSASNAVDRETAFALSARNTATAWSLSQLNAQVAMQASEDATHVALTLSEAEKRVALDLAAAHALVASAANDVDREAAFALSAENTERAWSLSESNARTALAASNSATKRALSFSEKEKDAALQLAASHAQIASAAVAVDRDAAFALSARNTAHASSLAEFKTQAALKLAEDATKDAMQRSKQMSKDALTLAATQAQIVSAANEADREAAYALSARNTATAWSLSELNTQMALKMSEDATRVALSLSEDEKGAALLLAATDAQVAIASNEADREEAFALSARNTATAWSLSELNAQTALKKSEDATRIALTLSENEKGAALLLAATDAQIVSAANEADREAALALSARNTATAWSLSELNTRTALTAAQTALRRVLSFNERDRKAAKQLADEDAFTVSAAAEVNRDAAIALHEDKMAIALKLSESSKNIFIARLMHEIRTPLHIISAQLSLADDIAGPTGQDLTVLRRQSAILQNAIGNFEFAGSIEKILLQKKIAFRQLDIQSFIRAEIAEALYLSLVGPVDVVVSVDSKVLNVVADVDLLRRSLRPLLSNAFEHRVLATAVDVRISLAALTKATTVAISNLSHAELKLPELFSMFHQHQTIDIHAPLQGESKDTLQLSSTKGLGLGLYTADKTLRALNSSLEFNCVPSLSRPQSFRVVFFFELCGSDLTTESAVLTRAAACQESPELRASPLKALNLESNAKKGLPILVVDDSPICRKLLIKILKDAGFNCDSANDGEEAVAMISTKQFAAVFMDLRMPVKDGLQATREVRALGISARIIALTAESSQEAKDEAIVAGVDAFILKPVRAERILAELLRQLSVVPEPEPLCV